MSATTPIEPRLRELAGGVAALRLLVLAWAVAVAVVDARSGVLDHRSAAFAVLAVVAAWTGTTGLWAANAPDRLVRPATLAVDLTLGVALVVADWLVYDGPHPQSFGSAWPATAVVLIAVAAGWRTGLAAGLAVGAANVVAAAAVGRIDGRGLALGGNVVLLATTGAVAGWVSLRLRTAESQVAAARERERFARTLHDGVLQTLAVVQRRSADTELVELARDQETELRRFIGSGPSARTDLVTEVRTVAAQVERHHRVRVEVVVVDEPEVRPDPLEALAGATTEALTNAAKHAAPQRITVCVDLGPDGRGALVTVVDDGVGFDVDTAPVARGLARSVHGRLAEVGGRATVRSTPGRGTEVALWVP